MPIVTLEGSLASLADAPGVVETGFVDAVVADGPLEEHEAAIKQIVSVAATVPVLLNI
jgi:hypothetical protein